MCALRRQAGLKASTTRLVRPAATRDGNDAEAGHEQADVRSVGSELGDGMVDTLGQADDREVGAEEAGGEGEPRPRFVLAGPAGGEPQRPRAEREHLDVVAVVAEAVAGEEGRAEGGDGLQQQ